MDSIYDGSGTNLIFTVIGLFVYPLYEASLAASAALLVVVLLIQGWLCAQIAFGLVRDDLDKGMTGMIAGSSWPAAAASASWPQSSSYLLISDNDKIRADYAYNKELQRIEDEETERQLAALQARLEAAKSGKLKDEA